MNTVRLDTILINLDHIVTVTKIVDTDISNNKKIRMQVTTKVDRFNRTLREGCIITIAMEHNTSFSEGQFQHNNAPLQLEVQNLMNYYVDN